MKIRFLFSALFVGLVGFCGLLTVSAEYSQELQDAYEWAHSVSVTTQTTIDSANMMGNITRAQMAKMISNYAKNILNKTADESIKCEFSDTESVKGDLATAIVESCQLGIMGQGITKFRPNDAVTRAEFGTVLSRTLWGDKNEGGEAYYENHLKALKEEGIMNKIETPSNKEIRGYVMLMLMRSAGDKASSQEDIQIDSESKSLVVYFSRADENYSVGDVTKGNTAYLAEHIANYLSADIFQIVPVVAYPSTYSETTEIAKKEQNDNARPEYQGDVDNWDEYDTIFLGYPIWWGDMPMVVYTFIENHNFDGKTVYLFNTHEGSGNAGTYNRVKEKLDTANVNTDGLTVRGSDARKDEAKDTTDEWLKGFGLSANPENEGDEKLNTRLPLVTLSNGVQVPQLGLGTQIQSLERDASEEGRALLNETSKNSVIAALQAGYRHLDTAHGYFNEMGVGEGIKESGVPREEIRVTSKLWPSEFGEGVTYEAIDKMLARLQLDYIDLIYLHHPAGDYTGAWKDLEKSYNEGKVRAIGISNFDNRPEAFQAIIDESTVKPQIMQIECHPFAQRTATKALAEANNMQVECWYPIGHADPELLQNETLVEIANNHNKAVVQVILRWHMQEGDLAVPGSTNPSHIQENIDIFDFELTEDEMNQIRGLDKGEEGRYFNLDYQQIGGFFTSPLDE